MGKFSICGLLTVKLCNKKLFNFSRYLFSLSIIYFGFTLFSSKTYEIKDMIHYKNSCSLAAGKHADALCT